MQRNQDATPAWTALHRLLVNNWTLPQSSASENVPFRPEVHLCAPSAADLPAEQRQKIQLLRQQLEQQNPVYRFEYGDLANDWAARRDIDRYTRGDMILLHFLIARQFDVNRAYKMLSDALLWRAKRQPGKYFQCTDEAGRVLPIFGAQSGKCLMHCFRLSAYL